MIDGWREDEILWMMGKSVLNRRNEKRKRRIIKYNTICRKKKSSHCGDFFVDESNNFLRLGIEIWFNFSYVIIHNLDLQKKYHILSRKDLSDDQYKLWLQK